MTRLKSEVRADRDGDDRTVRDAHAFFLAGLDSIEDVDIRSIRAGDDRFDYFVSISPKSLHEVSQRVADLEFAVLQKYDIIISALPIP